MNKRAYTGLDYFRVVAAFLVIAIHTSPLASYNEMADMILTRILARTAVPFFFLTSGFFLISQYQCKADQLWAFVKKTAVIYGISMVLYLPLNIYNGYFKEEYLLPNIIKDIVFDGTMYHLWYLPAAILGAVIAWYLVKKAGMKRALIVTAVLYLLGMLGDSYYGLTEQVPFLKNVYGHLFEISDYTRNGIFFAPVFFVLGGLLADRQKLDFTSGNVENIEANGSLNSAFCSKKRRRKHRLLSQEMSVEIGLAISLLLLLAEGILLHTNQIVRHDSMYLMLLPVMFFLFLLLLEWRGRRNKRLRSLALAIYIIHPMMIVAVRMAAKLLHQQKLLVENSLVHFVLVAALSLAVSMAWLWIHPYIRNIWRARGGNYCGTQICAEGRDVREKCHTSGAGRRDRAWVEISWENLRHNVRVLRKAMPAGCELMAVVKADAYGHNAFAVSAFLNKLGVRAFAVATIDEGIYLRKCGIQGEILIMGYTDPARARELHKYRLTQSLVGYDYALALSRQGYQIKSHIKVDTGMHRLGFDASDVNGIGEICGDSRLGVCGIYSHLCVADSQKPEDVSFTYTQIDRFYELIDQLAEVGIRLPKVHIQSSYGFLNYPELRSSYIRAGVALYGVKSSPGDETKLKLDLRPVLSLKSRIVLIKEVKEGETAGYGRAFLAKRDSRIAIVSIGYGDGVPRSLSCGNGSVLIGGRPAAIAGRVCMDVLLADVTDIPEAAVGDVVTVIGQDQGLELPAPVVAGSSGSISNELLCRIGERVKGL